MNYLTLINKIEDYVEGNLNNKISLDDIALNLNISKYYIHHIFSENSSETINKFVTRIKMERSAIFLVTCRNVNITEVALNYGYSDSSSYSRAFKKHFGICPLKYIKARNDKK